MHVVCSSSTVPRGAAAVVQRDVRQPGRRHHRLDAAVQPGQQVVQPVRDRLGVVQRNVQVSCHITGGCG